MDVDYGMLLEAFRRTYEYSFPLSYDTIRDIVKTLPAHIKDEQEVQQYMLKEMDARAKLFGRSAYVPRGLL